MIQAKKDFGIIFWTHLTLIILVYSSPILVSWYWIVLGALLLQLQFVIFNGCVLTIAQTGKINHETFYSIYLEKLGFKVNRYKLMRFMRYIMPLIVICVGLIWQLVFKIKPLWF